MSGWLRAALALQLLFFAGWGARLLTSHREGAIVWLATEPVDPRDLLSGHYVALRYPIATAAERLCDDLPARAGGTRVWIELAPTADAIPTDRGEVVASDAIDCRTRPPERGAHGLWMAGTVDGHDRVAYGIERMFVAEDDPRREARSGSVVAEVAVNDRFEARLVDLVPRRGGAR